MPRVGRTVFRTIVSYLTKGRLEARSCIDYYQDSLVNENVKLLKEIVNKETDPGRDHSEIPKRLDAVAGFLKYNYRNHVQYESEDGYHCISHGLLNGEVSETEPQRTKRSTCHLCLCPSKIVKDIRDVVVTNNPSVGIALGEAELKFKLYMGHVMRAKVQQDRIADVMRAIKDSGRGTRCVIYLDFKLKQLPKKLREPSQDWFGKRGMCWHGTAVFYDQ